jgi:hypothetical protein
MYLQMHKWAGAIASGQTGTGLLKSAGGQQARDSLSVAICGWTLWAFIVPAAAHGAVVAAVKGARRSNRAAAAVVVGDQEPGAECAREMCDTFTPVSQQAGQTCASEMLTLHCC